MEKRPILKLNYFKCRKGQLHQCEALNYVCIDKSCNQIGLICSVCKSDHEKHKVVPLKYLLNSLRYHKQNPKMESQAFQTQLQSLQWVKNSSLYDLKILTQKISQKIQQIEMSILESYKKRKIQLLDQIQIKMKFNTIIQNTLNNNLKNQDQFQKDFKTIASLVENSSENNRQQNLFYFSSNLCKIVQQYQQNYQQFSAQIDVFCKNILSGLNVLFDENYDKKDKQLVQKNIAAVTPQNTINQFNFFIPIQYKFNPILKGTNLTLSNNNKTAECTNSGTGRFALIDGAASKGKFIRFKVQKLKNWVGFGLAIRDNIKSKNYQFIYNNLGHGSFLLSNNGYMWSHAFSANNIQNSDFHFLEGNIIKIEVTETQLIFTNESQQNKVKKLPIALNQHEWNEACFCVNLCSIGDAATIL